MVVIYILRCKANKELSISKKNSSIYDIYVTNGDIFVTGRYNKKR